MQEAELMRVLGNIEGDVRAIRASLNTEREILSKLALRVTAMEMTKASSKGYIAGIAAAAATLVTAIGYVLQLLVGGANS